MSTEPSAAALPAFQDNDEATLLRFITCGSVDDGKSTLIGRLLYEAQSIYDDQLKTLAEDSKTAGSTGGAIDFSLLVDGLAAEREQKITIDVAYRFFRTPTRRFIVADTPGHEQYTRNMVTGASTADLAVILIDARKGVLTQTRRHSYLVSLLGVRRIVVAVNKMDLMAYSSDIFERIERDYRDFAGRIGIEDITCVPVSALHGDNVFRRSDQMPWYSGPSLMELLDSVPVGDDRTDRPFRMPVQFVGRPDQDTRWLTGIITSGRLRAGERVRILPSGQQSTITNLMIGDRPVDVAVADQSVAVTIAGHFDVGRGDVLSSVQHPPAVASRFEATVVWMDTSPMLPGRSYLMKLATQTVAATVAPLKYRINVNTLEHGAATTLQLNDIGVVGLELGSPVVFEPYKDSRDLGGFVLIDRVTNSTVAAGLLHFALRRSDNVHWQALDIDRQARATLKGQQPCVLWLTGLSGAGKSTIANLIEKRLHSLGHHTYILDGDNVRHGLNKDLGFTDADRVENIRRVAEVARLMADAGLIVIVSFISPFRAERRMARSLMPDGSFIEVFVDAPLNVAESRDPKGLYEKARRGALKNFTGIDSPYEVPENPELHIQTTTEEPTESAERVLSALESRGIVRTH